MLLPERLNKGSIAIKQGDGWKGVFNPLRSNPLIFGPTLWEILQENWNCLNNFGKDLLNYNYWAEYLNDGICPYCGKYDVGQPQQIQGDLIRDHQRGKVAPDPKAIYHSHFKQHLHVNSKNAKNDGLWIEWIYVIDPKTYMLEVLKSVRAEGWHTAIRPGKTWNQDNYQYIPVGLYSLLGEEPTWQEVEDRGLKMAVYYYDKFKSFQSTKIIVL